MSIINANPLLAAAGGDYQISRSVRLRSSASAYFNRTLASSGTTATFSAWVKRGALGAASTIFGTTDASTYDFQITFTASNTIEIYAFRSSAQVFDLITTAVYRDPSAWYHIVAVVNTTNATSTNRVQLYVNGVQVTAFGTASYPSQNAVTPLADSRTFGIGNRGNANNNYFDGYMTEVNFIDGQALTPSSFGETDAVTGVWKPKKYAGTYGTNGFYLNFSDPSAATAAAIGKDYSGNGNNWTPNNISVTSGVTYDSMLDTPTPYADGGNGRGNYAVMNPLLDWKTNGSAFTLSEGNLRVTEPAGTTYGSVASTIAMPSGKWYCEFTVIAASGVALVGVTSIDSAAGFPGQTASSYAYHQDGRKFNNNTGSSYGATYTANDVIGVAFDADSGSVTFYKNGTSQGTAFSSIAAGSYYFVVGDFSNSVSTFVANFGQRPFAYTPPTSFVALNTQNLPDSTIKKGNLWFDATLWTGDGASSKAITNSGSFQPDLVWVKKRNSATNSNHYVTDAVRGVTNTIITNGTNAEFAASGGVTAFNSNGFTLGADTNVNNSSDTYVGWQWKESASAGFDIVTYTGTGANRTVAHSLGVTPSMIIVKNRSALENWIVYHRSFTSADSFLRLNTTDAVASGASVWNSTYPTSSVFSVGTNTATNANTQNFVAYLFAEVAGFSRFGSYTGNGSADGPFVFCGFRPRYLMIRDTGSADWDIQDTARSPYNTSKDRLWANLSSAEVSSTYDIDFLSNGFKIRSTNPDTNSNGGTKIYMAFAESPFKISLAR